MFEQAERKQISVLVLEDHPDDAELMMIELWSAGFAPSWWRVDTREEYLARLDQPLDLILADYSLPQFDAPHALRLMQERKLDIPFIVVSGSIGEDAAVLAIHQGATDYLLKDRLARLGSAVTRALEQRRLRDEKHEADLQLQANELRFRNLIEHAPDGIALLNDAGIFHYLSPSFQKIMGYTAEQTAAWIPAELTHPDDLPRMERMMNDLMERAGDVITTQYRFRHANGSWRWLEATISNMLHVPEVRSLTFNFRDITERKASDEALAKLNNQLVHTLESITDAFIAVDREWRVMYINAESEKLVQCSRTDSMGTMFWDLFPQAEDTPISRYLHAAMEHQEPAAFDAWYAPLNMWLEMRVFVMPEGLSIYFRDVTQERRDRQLLEEREVMLSALFANTLDAILIADDDGMYVDANPAACTLFGLPREQLLGRRIIDFTVADFQDSSQADWESFLESGISMGTFRLQRPDGNVRYIDFRARAHFLPGFHLSVLRDRTEHYQAERAVQTSEEYLRALVEHSAEIISVLEDDGNVRYVSPALRRLLGLSEDEVIGHLLQYVHPEDKPLLDMVDNRLEHGGTVSNIELRMRHKDGSWRVFESTITNLLTNSAVHGLVINSHDVTERKRAELELAHSALYDALTGLPNRTLFLDRLQQAIQLAARPSVHPCVVLFVDLDRFRSVNDYLGHAVGDQLLIEVARRLEHCVSSSGTVARFGGDEFAILLENTSLHTAVAVVAECILATLRVPFQMGEHEIVVSASIGIAFSTLAVTAEEVLRDADIAMYQAKRGGSSRYAIADSDMHTAIWNRMHLEADLRRALDREEFVVYYQPKMSIDGKTMLGMEALIRWQHPQRGFVSPVEFIPLAEETGLIIPIGAWVLRTVCQQLRAWSDVGLPSFFVSVNLSAYQFKQPGIADFIRSLLEANDVPAHLLGLELTETVLMENAEATVMALQELREIGIAELAIDDFGTGYSSLSYLQRFPVTDIKIDKSFVHDIMVNRSNGAIATATIALAHSLGITVIAEGIETEEQRVFLEECGCDHFQGYLASRPMPAEQVPSFCERTQPPKRRLADTLVLSATEG